jgi:hypothetical protein
MRDVSHQTAGAAALGLYSANLNMLGRFAAAVSPTRDWAGYWEIDRFGHPSPADYVSDDDFWYNLPANFDLLDAIVRMWRWTGNDKYLNDPRFRNFYESTAAAYLKAWDLQPDRVLKRSRIMHQRLREGKFVRARGIPSYTEGREDFNVGTDLLATEYRAFKSLRLIALSRHKVNLAAQYDHTADEIAHLIEHKAWSEEEHHYMGFFSPGGRTQGSGDAMVLYFGATSDPIHIRGALTHIKSPEYLKNIGIEEESYLPQTFYHYGEKAAAYERMMDLSSPDKDRREYPEVSFAVIGAMVSGMMGVETIYGPPSESPLIRSMSRLVGKSDIATMKGIRIRQNLMDLKHTGDQESSLTNRSGPPLHWQATFFGKVSSLKVNGRPVRTKSASDSVGALVSWIIVDVPLGATAVVSRP